MKTVIIEGTDRVGKSSLIEGLCKHFEYDNVFVRHCGKPPKHVSKDNVLDWQLDCFYKEARLAKNIFDMENDELQYYENKIIYNRYYLGEYVYGSMFRNIPKDTILKKLNALEKVLIDVDNTYLVTLVGDPKFLMTQEDGNSFSDSVEKKSTEIGLFVEITEKSLIKNKLVIEVDNGNNQYFPKEQILKSVLDFISGSNGKS